jgi:Queuosine biosynthesis protein QueC
MGCNHSSSLTHVPQQHLCDPVLVGIRFEPWKRPTSHPVVLSILQRVLDAAGLRVQITNPYQFKTKGEMLVEGLDHSLLLANAHRTTSCGRFKRYGYKHCGRCVPCLIRRASFAHWSVADSTPYMYKSLTRDDKEHARYDDVRAVAMAIADVKENGLEAWLGASLSSSLLRDKDALRQVARRGLDEVAQFLQTQKIR